MLDGRSFAALLSLSCYPIQAITLITICVLVIWELTSHGRDIAAV